MFVKENYSFLRTQKLYEREISRILYQLIREENQLPSCSLSYLILSPKKENLKIYLDFAMEKEAKKMLDLINSEYVPFIRKEIAQTKKFSRIPRLIFLSTPKTF